jgi:sodium/potassium-transporting ATPase subunit alpha
VIETGFPEDAPKAVATSQEHQGSSLAGKPETPDEIADSRDHLFSLHELAVLHPASRIVADQPNKSGGLTDEEAEARLRQYGPNALTPPPSEPLIVMFLKQFRDPFLILLAIASILSFIAYGINKSETDMFTGIALMVVVFLTAFIAFIQEAKVANVMEKFGKLLPSACIVIRNGQERNYDAHHLVPGDIVKIKGGDRVPADMRIIFSQNLKVENASITGESRPVTLVQNQSSEGVPPTESTCLAFKASNCVEGEALGLVVRTGDHTLIGQIAHLTASSEESESTLQIEIKHVIKVISG